MNEREREMTRVVENEPSESQPKESEAPVPRSRW